jgi:hypothetical protein
MLTSCMNVSQGLAQYDYTPQRTKTYKTDINPVFGPRLIQVTNFGDVYVGNGTWDLKKTTAKVNIATKEVRIDGKTYRLNPDGTATHIQWKNQ